MSSSAIPIDRQGSGLAFAAQQPATFGCGVARPLTIRQIGKHRPSYGGRITGESVGEKSTGESLRPGGRKGKDGGPNLISLVNLSSTVSLRQKHPPLRRVSQHLIKACTPYRVWLKSAPPSRRNSSSAPVSPFVYRRAVYAAAPTHYGFVWLCRWARDEEKGPQGHPELLGMQTAENEVHTRPSRPSQHSLQWLSTTGLQMCQSRAT